VQLPEWLKETTSSLCRAAADLPVDQLPAHRRHPGEPGFAAVPLPRLLNVEDYLDYVTNRVVPDYAIREALEKLWSPAAFMVTATAEDRLAVTAEVAHVGTNGTVRDQTNVGGDCDAPPRPNSAGCCSPGGRASITDITADGARLPAELTSQAAWVACVADARPLEGYAAMLTATGLPVTRMERHDAAAARMIDQIAAPAHRRPADHERSQAAALGLDFDQAGPVLAAAKTAIAKGIIGYGLLVAEKPA
jgi:hypothetical protein